MVEHIWEIRNSRSIYYFFNRNCSYEVLWLVEIARPSVELRHRFFYQIIPFETIHAMQKANLLESSHYRPSKRSIIEAYKNVLDFQQIQMAKQLYQNKLSLKEFLQNNTLSLDKKRYILEVSIELLQYYYQKNEISKETYLERFHNLTSARATLGKTKKVTPKQPPNPLSGHRANRLTLGGGAIEENEALFFGYRPAYHDLEDAPLGFLRGVQTEFFNFDFSLTKEKFRVEKATMIAVSSIAQIDSFFTPFSWRATLGWDTNSLEDKSRLHVDIGFGSSVGNDYGYAYLLTNLYAYDNKVANFAAGVSAGVVIDGFGKYTNTLMEYTYRFYDNKEGQHLIDIAQNFRISQNTAIKLKYTYKNKYSTDDVASHQQYFMVLGSWYF
jgi:hypothetical protein